MPTAYRLQKTELIGIEPIQDLLELTIYSAYIKSERVVSSLFVSEPEGGKTELIKKYRKNRGIHNRRRFTYYGIINDIIDGRVKILHNSPKILGHIMVYDYAGMFTYKPNTVDSTIEFIDALTEDGLSPESSYWIRGDEFEPFVGLKGGLIAGINTFGFFTKGRKVRANLYKGGWFSRNVVSTYDISETMLTKIFDSVANGKYRPSRDFVEYIILQLPMKRVDIEMMKKYMTDVGDLSRELAEEYSYDLRPYKLKGIRLNKSLISLTKASALREGRGYVTEDDVERIKYISQWMNLKMNKLKLDYPFPTRGKFRTKSYPSFRD
jgi:hypothetical protein